MPLRQRNVVTAVLSYFMAWCIVALPAVPIQLFSAAGMLLVVAIGTPVALLGAALNTRAEREKR
jgi:predicted exporter